MSRVLPVAVVVAVIVALWYLGAVWMNAKWAYDQAARAGVELSFRDMLADTMAQERPVLPAPHQVAAELWETIAEKPVTSKRSLVWHGWITLSATLLGFAMGTALGILLAIGIVHNRAMDLSVMPWVIASQTIPILAVAPMIIVVLNAVGLTGLVPKAIISMYLSFFPVVVGMVKGLRAPDRLMLDQMRTWGASPGQVLWKLRLPASLPHLFAAMKVAVAVSLVGAIIGELPTGAQGGFGTRLLSGSYYGQTMIIWSALVAAAVTAGLLVGLVGLVQRLVGERTWDPGFDLRWIAGAGVLGLVSWWLSGLTMGHIEALWAWLVAAGARAAGWDWRWLGGALAFWAGAWVANLVLVARAAAPTARIVVPALFGAALFVLWEGIVRGAGISPVLLPPPSVVAVTFAAETGTLWDDFVQTILRSALPGWVMGCGAGFLVAIAIDRSPFLQRGLLPVGNLASALPIVGVAPIMVMWFGADWHSKAAVVVLMTFFPMLVSTTAGLAATDRMQRDLMRTYAAGYWQTLLRLRLPAAAPFLFTALKITSTLALIGAIVAEFFGTPTVGMGFRISTEVGRMNIGMVWAEIAVAALAGSLFYGAVALTERRVTFWHPSQRA